MAIETYSDYIIEKMEFWSFLMLGSTLLVYLSYGIAVSLLPCIIFHAVAYSRYRAYIEKQRSELIKGLRNESDLN